MDKLTAENIKEGAITSVIINLSRGERFLN